MTARTLNDRRIMTAIAIAAAGILAASIAGNQTFVATATVVEQMQADKATAGEFVNVSAGSGMEAMDDIEKPSWIYILNKKYTDYENGVSRVRAGVGNHLAPLTAFFPQNVTIKAGETVIWYNPTTVGEPHTVTFINDPKGFAPIEAPFIVMNSSNIVPLDPTVNADPALMPGPNGTMIAIIANARSYSPVTMTEGKVEYLPPNANYTLTGNESYVNSGWIWPPGQTLEGLQEIESFSVKFENTGQYGYICLVHPWMAGTVTVT